MIGLASVWLLFFGHTKATRRLYGPWLWWLGRYIPIPKTKSLQPLRFAPVEIARSADFHWRNATSSLSFPGGLSQQADIQIADDQVLPLPLPGGAVRLSDR